MNAATLRPLFGLFAAALALAACDPAAPPPVAPPKPPVASDPEDAPPPSPEVIAAEVQAGEGKACAKDAECAMYLRCVEAKCVRPPALEGKPSPGPTPALAFITARGEVQFRVELAIAPEERSRGLMYRPKMHPEWGMLFVYPKDREMVFWMKNTYMPLDMVFINDAREVVGVVAEATPLTLDERKVPGTQSRYVLELAGGVAAKHGIQAGQKVIFANVPE